jgi:CheY-like chemotaxis protein
MILHIAYIESDKHSRFTFEQIAVVLRARGFDNQLYCYTSPAEALEHLPLERPDIVFVDLRTHNGQKPAGLDLVRLLRQHPLCQNTLIVGMAEYAMPGDRAAALAGGCQAFLPKPVRYQTVEEIIASLGFSPVR